MRALFARLAGAAIFVLSALACTEETAKSPASADGGTTKGPSSSSGSTSSGSPPDATVPPREIFVDVSNETMEFGGKTRSYVLGKPKNYNANKAYPLVLSFHGSPGAATAQAAGLPFDSVSKAAAVIVYPQAATENWELYAPNETNPDMGWIHALPDEIATKANIDKSKIFGFGYSGGGFFLAQFTCRFGDVFKAISINAGGAPHEPEMGYGKHDNGCYQCPGGPVATIVTHGAADPEVEPGSGEFAKTCFATFNGCGDTLSDTTPAPCQQVDGCPADKPVKWCLIPGQGHGPWAQAMTEAWSFFSAVP
ncbi:MAG TPA: PHB depolymerase family esterase [Labilithrix sp.]|nr:PHB depolymerase family esterase [Labilithrix sp.]